MNIKQKRLASPTLNVVFMRILQSHTQNKLFVNLMSGKIVVAWFTLFRVVAS
jgi:hypothetical protein